jgi:uncharacterized protein DUF1353
MITVPRFLTDLEFVDLNRRSEPNTKRFQFKLRAPLIFESVVLNRTITVPEGFVTDLASVPRFFWPFVSPIGKYDDACVLHDWLYNVGGVERKQADDVLREAMSACGVAHDDQWVIYHGVRAGGWLPWRRYRKQGTVESAAKAAHV